ncbi:ABC transporter substrate-binding protein [Roseobacter sp. CCS2]|uniref:ABC transporter substrate-binding protein n=1 Tax=Roseobacter sp. CCS2 TaxID=391593 RepID=UPI0000F403A2|nr:ABC transporter substrate-binding protein [Roseobacter sp. CCS2]EBA13658.1 putative iron compound-binding protein of ABC transporter family [Roseobacter sp. CCS2]
MTRFNPKHALGFAAMKLILAAIVMVLILPVQAIAQDMRTVVDDTGVEVTIPVNPQRIISGHDLVITIPMIELGVFPVGSHGRGETLDEAFIRGSAPLTGVDFDNSDIEWVGNRPIEVERIAAQNPDLIITTAWQPADVEQLRLIAPTFVVDISTRDEWSVFDLLADLTGTDASLKLLKRRYQIQIDAIRDEIDTGAMTISTIHAYEGQLFAYNPYGTIGKVLIDAGFDRPDLIENAKQNVIEEFSAELMPEFDGDFIITTYRSSAGDTPDAVRDYFEGVLPGYCDVLHACRNDQMYFLSRAEAAATSYAALIQTAYTLRTILGGRTFVPLAD